MTTVKHEMKITALRTTSQKNSAAIPLVTGLYLARLGKNERNNPYAGFGILFFFAVAVTYGLFLSFLPSLIKYSPVTKGIAALFFWLVVLSAVIFISCLTVVMFLNLRIYARVHTMEASLAEYLQLVITNLKSGMSFEQSLWAAARPEFGVLSAEITLVSKQVLTGVDTTDALREFSMRYDSAMLIPLFKLVITSCKYSASDASMV